MKDLTALFEAMPWPVAVGVCFILMCVGIAGLLAFVAVGGSVLDKFDRNAR